MVKIGGTKKCKLNKKTQIKRKYRGNLDIFMKRGNLWILYK